MADIIDLTRYRTVRVARDPSGRLPPMTLRDGNLILNQDPAETDSLATIPAAVRVVRVSRINPDFPVFGVPTTQSVRDNFQAAKDEIEGLQANKLDLSGGVMTGPITFIPNQIFDGGVF